MKNEALKSLFGGKVRAKRALAGNVGTKQEEREQTVLTPEWLLAELRERFGPILLDPCTVPENPTRACHFCCGRGEEGGDGLTESWGELLLREMRGRRSTRGFAYVNPPYADLEEWLGKCREEGAEGVPIAALIPFRPQRAWFRGAEWIYPFAPFAFQGHAQAFPAPLCLLTWNLSPLGGLFLTTKKGLRKNMILGTLRYE